MRIRRSVGTRAPKRLCVTLALVAALSGCSAIDPPRTSSPSERRGPTRSDSPGRDPDRVASDPRVQIVDLAFSLVATPYRYRGTSRDGFDCSGLTSYVFSAVGRLLPRTADEQARIGTRVALDELGSGDLVFFGPSHSRLTHVGIVVSEPAEGLSMVHASTSRGVVLTDILADDYWLSRLRFGRRLLPPQPMPRTVRFDRSEEKE